MRTAVLVTGATGLVGQRVVRHFLDQERSVIMATSTPGVTARHPRLSVVPFQLGATGCGPEMEIALRASALVIHAAARLPGPCPASPEETVAMMRENALGTYSFMEQAVAAALPHFIYISTMSFLESRSDRVDESSPVQPRDAYGLSKWMGEVFAMQFQKSASTHFCCLRIRAPYGPGYRRRAVIPLFLEQALQGRPIEVSGIGARRQVFTFVADIARACDLAASAHAAGVYHIAGPSPVSMLTLAETIRQVAGPTGSEVLLLTDREEGPGCPGLISTERARDVFGYTPGYDLERGLGEMARIMREGEEQVFYVRS